MLRANSIILVHLTVICILSLSSNISVRAARARSRCGFLDLKANSTVSTLTSPNYPRIYPNELNCVWNIKSELQQNIVIKLVDVFIEESDSCNLDVLAIYNGSEAKQEKLITRLCGRGHTGTFYTKSADILIVFTSDNSVEERGFKLEYHAGEETGCHQILTSSTGIVTSPRYPSYYPDLSECSTLIRLPENQQISLTFDDLSLEFDDDCKSDYVEVFDGPNKEKRSLGRFCRMWGLTSLQSTQNELFIVFHSDRLVNAKGFKATYTSAIESGSGDRCQREQFQTNGTFRSTNYPEMYEANSNCKYLVSGPEGTTIVFVIEDLHIEYSPLCDKDFLEVRDGKDIDSKSLGRFCGESRNIPKRVIISTSNHILMIFKSDSFDSGKGFKASYFIQEKNDDERVPFTSLQQDTSKFKHFPENATVEEGESHTFRCSSKNGFWKWFKDDIPIDEMKGLRFADTGTLIIDKMEPALVGVYACEAYTIEGTFVAYSWLQIKPKIVCSDSNAKASQTDKRVFEDDTLFLDCSTAGINKDIQWLKNGKPLIITDRIKSSEGVLKISRTTVADSGLYECLVKNTKLNCEERILTIVVVKPRVCGQPKVNPNTTKLDTDDENRIIGGRDAARGAYPWQIVFDETSTGGRGLFCGGSLLNSKWVLTAAHCFNEDDYDIEEIKARLGEHNVQRTEPGEMSSKLKNVTPHPDYDYETKEHDVAVVELTTRITFTDYISTICFEVSKKGRDFVFKDESFHKGTVAGWGITDTKTRVTPNVLQELVLPIQPQKECIASLSDIGYKITENMFCAGYKQQIMKRDSCEGDSGGPLAIKFQDRWIVVGIVSVGPGCAVEGRFGIYTKVDKYVKWIKNHIYT